MPEKVEFTGTVGVADTTQRTFKGSATYEPRASTFVGSVLRITIPITLSVALLKVVFDFNPNLYFPTIPSASMPPATTAPVSADEPLSARLRAHGIDSHIVIIGAYHSEALACAVEEELRQRRVYAKHLADKSRYYVYVGPLYSKQRVNSALKSLKDLGYTEAYGLYPN